ncbi:MAG: InlB B-repeat-containing protein, partial [Eubacterium sp.]|nr:InlB B-repeat-containing protein [Eubacterium sp.]
KDEECTVPWNFEEDTVQGAAVLYAGWTEAESEEADPSLTDGDNSIEDAGNPDEAADAGADGSGIFDDTDAEDTSESADGYGETSAASDGYSETADITGIFDDADVTGGAETPDSDPPEFLKDLRDKTDASDRIKDSDTPAAQEDEEFFEVVNFEITLPTPANGMTAEEIAETVSVSCTDSTGAVIADSEDFSFAHELFYQDDIISAETDYYLKGVPAWFVLDGEIPYEVGSLEINGQTIPHISEAELGETVMVNKASCFLSEPGYLTVFYSIYEEAAPCTVSAALPTFTEGMTPALAAAATTIDPALTNITGMFSDDGTDEYETAYIPDLTSWFILEGTTSDMPTSVLLDGISIPIIYGTGFAPELMKDRYLDAGISHAYYRLEDGNAVFGLCVDVYQHEPGTGAPVSVTINGNVTDGMTVEEAAARVSVLPENAVIYDSLFTGDEETERYMAGDARFFVMLIPMEEEPASVSLNGNVLPILTNMDRLGYYVQNGEESFAAYGNNMLYILEYVYENVPRNRVWISYDGREDVYTLLGKRAAGCSVEIDAGIRGGHRFTGWESDDDIVFEDPSAARTTFVMPDREVNIRTNWEPVSYTVTFDPVGGTVDPETTVTNEYGELDVYPEPEPLDSDLYEFVGWYSEKIGGEELRRYNIFEEETTLYAHWNIKRLEVDDLDVPSWGETPDHTVSVPEGSFYRLMTPQEVLEYNSSSSLPYSAENSEGGVVWFSRHSDWTTSIMESTDLFNNEEDLYYMRAYVVVTEPGYVFDEYTYPEMLVNGDSYLGNSNSYYEDDQEKRHYVASTNFEVTEPTGSYMVTFDPNGGSLEGISETTVETDGNGRLSALPVPGNGAAYSFDGWYTRQSGGTKVYLNNVFNADTTLYAHWTITNVSVSGRTTPDWGENPDFALEIPEDAHYHFATFSELGSVRWSDRSWAVNGVFWNHYDYDGSRCYMTETDVFNDEQGTYALETYIVPDEGYSYTASSTALINDSPVHSEIVWGYLLIKTAQESAAAPADVPRYSVTIDAGESAYGAGSYPENALVTINAGNAETGYEFGKWISNDGVVFDDETSRKTTFVMPAQDVAVSAEWEMTDYWVQLYGGGEGSYIGDESPAGENPDVASFHYGDTVTIHAGTRNDAAFIGWESDCPDIEFADPTSETTTFVLSTTYYNTGIYAIWDETLVTLTVHHEGVGIDSDDTHENIKAGEAIEIKVLPRKGYRFAGWNCNDEEVVFEDASQMITRMTMPSRHVTVTASWEAIEYELKVEGGAEGSFGSGKYKYNQITSVSAGSREGYRFIGWTSDYDRSLLADDKAAVTFVQMPDRDVTITANWEIIEYPVTVNGGTAGSGTTDGKSTIGQTVSIKAAEKAGYVFRNWTSEDGVVFADATSASTTFVMP